jgi:hypothetical protein
MTLTALVNGQTESSWKIDIEVEYILCDIIPQKSSSNHFYSVLPYTGG